jgi:dTDP-4-dehydrorhamnose reductase
VWVDNALATRQDSNIYRREKKAVAALKLPDDKRTLIVGINSQMGAGLAERLASENLPFFGTTRNIDNVSDQVIYFDLLDSDVSLPLQDFDFVIVCSAVTNIAECEYQLEKSKRVNVTKTIQLIDRCLANGCFVIYPSSNAVFDGTVPFNLPGDQPNPKSMYGFFKLAVEEHITKNADGNAAIVRFTKIITHQSPFLRSWRENAKMGSEITAFQDKFFSPIPIEDVVTTLYMLMIKRRAGVFQLGGAEEISYLDYARQVFAGDPTALDLLKAVEQPEPKSFFNYYNSLATRLPE